MNSQALIYLFHNHNELAFLRLTQVSFCSMLFCSCDRLVIDMSCLVQVVRSSLDIITRKSGLNSDWLSQFSDSEQWLEASSYFGDMRGRIHSSNVVLDLTISQNYNYQRELLNGTVSDYLADNIDRGETIDRINQEWNPLTDKLAEMFKNLLIVRVWG